LKNYKHILISRTDSIGDVILTLPLVGLIKRISSQIKITFLGQSYTRPILESCEHVDQVLCWDEIKDLDQKALVKIFKSWEVDAIIHVFPNKKIAETARLAGIKKRVGTARRISHITTCNSLINLSRKGSDLHEAQLNIKFLDLFEYEMDCPKEDLWRFYGMTQLKSLNPDLKKHLSEQKFNLILHPKSKGSAREWGLKNFSELISFLPQEKFNILITGTKAEGEMLIGQLPFNQSNVVNLTGMLTLEELISFISLADGLLASSTGPLHIAAALQKHALGIYAPMRPIHPGRWAPLGVHTKVFVKEKVCNDCRISQNCLCIHSVAVKEVGDYLNTLTKP
jgi:heptosyltransferase-3